MKKHWLLLFLIVAMQYSKAQPVHLSFDHLNVPTGLPESNVQNILQDNRGYIWLTTQSGVVRYDGYQVKVYKPGIEDHTNVPNLIFYSIFLDKNHDLWVNSFSNGLFKYDRLSDRFTQYKNKNRENEGSQLWAMIDSTGKIWSEIHYGDYQINILEQFDPATGVFKRFGNHQKGKYYINCKQINNCYIDHQGSVWLGTDNGVYHFAPLTDRFTGYLASSDTLQQRSTYIIYQAPSTKGVLWMAEMNKKDKCHSLLRMDILTGRIDRFDHLSNIESSLGNEMVNTAFEDKNNRLWFGTDSGISLYDDKKKRFSNYVPIDSKSNKITNIQADRDGLLWMTCSYGLLCFNPETRVFKRYIHDKDEPSSLADNAINSLFFDQDGTLWITISWGGVDRVNPIKSAFLPPQGERKRFPWHDLHAVVQAPNGEWWIAAQNGLFRYNKLNQTFALVEKAPVKRVCLAKNGRVYYHPIDSMSNGDGLEVFDPLTGNKSHYKNIPNDSTSLSNNDIQCILEDHTGIIWLGTVGNGICAFNPNTKKFMPYPFIINDNTRTSHNMLDHNDVTSMFEDSKGTLWVGTDAGGLNHFDRKRNIFISAFRPQDGLSTVTSITQDNNGRLWAGTYLNGLFLVDNHTGMPLKRFTMKDGLLMDQVLLINSDVNNFLWIASERGFSKLNTSSYAIKTYKAEGNYWQNIFYNVSTGYDKINIISVMDKNLVLIGGDDIVTFNTRSIIRDVRAPIVHIETMTYGDPRTTKESSVTIETYGSKNGELSWYQNKIIFNYVALHYTDPTGSLYAYRLNGYDNRWIQAGNQRSATYTNLSPGTYTFHVIAANSDGVWDDRGDSFTFIIRAPWWQKWWAWILYIVIFVAAVYSFIIYRSRRLMHDKRVLEHKVHIRTEEVLQQKEEIETQRDALELKRNDLENTLNELKVTQMQLVQREKMASLGELTAGIAHEIQNPLNFVNNFSEVSAELVDELDDELEKGDIDEAKALTADVKENLTKIRHHGERADLIVKGMLEHSRTSTGEKRLTDINLLVEEFLKLSFNGLKAKDKSFDIKMTTHFDPNLPKINAVQQDLGRVLLNLFSNAFYAVNQKQKTAVPEYRPTVDVLTSLKNGMVEIKVKDNGNGIPENIKYKIMQPFFTTKPTGEGTGLGLSLSFDIVVKGHNGTIDFTTKENEYSEFIVALPL
jgi:ligand-binding sensor domain-containing protein/signal transduction histidine kinase